MSGNLETAQLTRQVRELPLPVGLVDLESGLVVGISDTAVEFGPLSAAEIMKGPVIDRIHADYRSGTAAALSAMADGNVDMFRARPLALSADPSRRVITWVRRLDVDDRRVALFELADEAVGGESPLAAYLGRDPMELAVGTVDETGVITRMSTSISRLLGVEADVLIGQELLGRARRDDVDRVLDAVRIAGYEHAVGIGIGLRGSAGTWQPFRLVITPLRGRRAMRAFILMPEPRSTDGQSARAADLEHHLRNIAREVEAAGIVMGLDTMNEARLPLERGALTARQWEVLTRLLRGERVPTIAAELYLSQSTVRGHVSAVLRHFGVHSQPELLQLLRRPSL